MNGAETGVRCLGPSEKIHEAACRSEFGKYDSIAHKVSSLSFIILISPNHSKNLVTLIRCNSALS